MLEFYALADLRFAGTIAHDVKEEMFGIIVSPNNEAHRVGIGNYIGPNHGRVIKVSEYGIDQIEVVPDERGDWKERGIAFKLIGEK